MKRRSHAAILNDVARTNDRIRAITERLNVALAHRRDVYAEARDRDDPVSYGKLAAAAGTTEGAVMQVYKKGHRADQGGT